MYLPTYHKKAEKFEPFFTRGTHECPMNTKRAESMLLDELSRSAKVRGRDLPATRRSEKAKIHWSPNGPAPILIPLEPQPFGHQWPKKSHFWTKILQNVQIVTSYGPGTFANRLSSLGYIDYTTFNFTRSFTDGLVKKTLKKSKSVLKKN